VILEAPTGETLLYDDGSLASPNYATQTVAACLWHRGVVRLDGIILSHADVDHFNAVPGLVDRFGIRQAFVSPVMFDDYGTPAENQAPLYLRKSLDESQIPIREIWAGDRLHLGAKVDIQVLHPPRQGSIGSDNANSLTLAIQIAGRRLLLTGDLETPGLEDVLAEMPYDCDVLLAPHHGSRRSDPPGFAAWSTPEYVVISGAGGEDVQDVVETYKRFGANVLRTDTQGAIDIYIGHDGSVAHSTWHPP
jgi:competence protein ComEC